MTKQFSSVLLFKLAILVRIGVEISLHSKSWCHK